MIFQKLKLSQFIRTRPLKFPSRPSHPKKFLSRPVIYFQNPIPSRWYLIPSRPDKNLLTGSRPVPTQCSGGDGDGMVAITYIFAIIIVRLARYVLHDAQRRRRRGGVRHHARRRRRRGGDSVRTSRALRSDAVRTGRSISLNTLITAATLNPYRGGSPEYKNPLMDCT